MADFNLEQSQEQMQIIKKPFAVLFFGVMNIVFGCYFLVRIGHSWYRTIPGILMNQEHIISGLLFFLILIAGTGLVLWLIVLGIGLLLMKRWARRGSVLYGWIQVVLIAITLGAALISMITSGAHAYRIFVGSIHIGNVLAMIQSAYMVLLLVYMRSAKMKEAFSAVGG